VNENAKTRPVLSDQDSGILGPVKKSRGGKGGKETKKQKNRKYIHAGPEDKRKEETRVREKVILRKEEGESVI